MQEATHQDISPYEVKVKNAVAPRVTVRSREAPRERTEIRVLLAKDDSLAKAGGNEEELPTFPESRPFDDADAKLGLLSAGYLELFDVSRKKIKTRFVHGLEKLQFKVHLQAFLAQKIIKPTTEYMVRFVGKTDVHSPFIHIFTSTLLEDSAALKVSPTDTEGAGSTLWTYLRTSDTNQVHWSCKKTGFWPVRIVLEGPPTLTYTAETASEHNSSFASRSRARSRDRSRDGRDDNDDDDAAESPEVELRRNTRQNSKHINHPKKKIIDFNELDSDKPEKEPITRSPNDVSESPVQQIQTPSSPPTIGTAMRQLGAAVVNAIPPAVTHSVQQKFEALRGWTRRGQIQDVGDEEREVLEREAAERRERRRLRRLARPQAEDREDDAEAPEQEVWRSSRRERRQSSRSRR
ncbi:hypothetical protein ACM66B_005156 [Microbotryomycetes sp. NB124-2]